MASIIEELEDIKRRLSLIENMLGITKQSKKGSNYTNSNPAQKEEVEENTINGFGKDQLRVMFNWAKSAKLSQISKRDFEELKKWGMLWEFYPNAPENYEDIIL